MTAKSSNTCKREHTRIGARLLKIHQAIRGNKFPSLDKLKEIVERDTRTVRRDLQKLREDYDAPLVYDRAKNGYRYRDPLWDFDFNFTEGELLAFFIAERALKTMKQDKVAVQLRTALAKLTARLPEQVSIKPSTILEAMTHQSLPHVEIEMEMLNKLFHAAYEKRTIEIIYHSQHRNQTMKRKIDVLHLHNFAGDWYAIAFDHLRGEVRDFHIGRIKKLEHTQDYFDPPANWNQEEHLRRGFYMTRGGRKTKVQIIFDEYQSRWMRERQKFHPDEEREDLPDGSMRLTFSIGSNGLEAVARFCLAYAGHFRVEEPAALKKIIREKLEKALAQNFPV
jgi:predicted DNA-binding transcriptional regulator YafY